MVSASSPATVISQVSPCIREEGLNVLGFGKNTPEAFRNACHKFVFTEVLRLVSNVAGSRNPYRGLRQRCQAAGSHNPGKERLAPHPAGLSNCLCARSPGQGQ